jgi:hypothetical protein
MAFPLGKETAKLPPQEWVGLQEMKQAWVLPELLLPQHRKLAEQQRGPWRQARLRQS